MSFEQITVEHHQGIAVLRLASGKLNAITSTLLREAKTALGDLKREDAVRAVILTGGESRFFSFGLDVAGLLTVDRAAMESLLIDLNDVLKTLFLFPKPVVAAVNGHAMAGGLLLAMTADYRIGAEGKFSISLSEVNLGLAPPAVSLRIMAHHLGHAVTREAALTGRIYDPVEAFGEQILNELAPPERLMERAREKATELGGLPSGGVALNKRFLSSRIVRIDPVREREENDAWLDAWFSEDAQERLKALVEKR